MFAALALKDQGAPEIHLAETNPLRRKTVESTGVVADRVNRFLMR